MNGVRGVPQDRRELAKNKRSFTEKRSKRMKTWQKVKAEKANHKVKIDIDEYIFLYQIIHTSDVC